MKDNNQANNIESQAATQSQPTVNPTDNFTIEEFHKALEENTRRLAEARTAHTENLKKAQNIYLETLTEIAVKEAKALRDYREARKAWEEAQDAYQQAIRCYKIARNKAGQDLNYLKTEEANQWAAFNNRNQSERHNIFERYRNSGGQFSDNTGELLHPGWNKKQKGVSDEQA